MNLSFEEIGTGKPVVLIHAFPLSRRMWHRQAGLLADKGFRVILPDLPGFGETPVSSPRSSIEEMAAKVDQLLTSLNIEKAIIGGLSMGGYVLLQLFRAAPHRFSALILCDTTDLADTDEKRDARFELIAKIEKQGAEALVENMLPKLISEHTRQDNPQLVSELERTFGQVNPASAVGALQSMAERPATTDIPDQITVPTLLLFGEFDQVTNLENAREMRGKISGSELVIVKNAGHYANLEQPDQFNAALLDFCRRVSL